MNQEGGREGKEGEKEGRVDEGKMRLVMDLRRERERERVRGERGENMSVGEKEKIDETRGRGDRREERISSVSGCYWEGGEMEERERQGEKKKDK